MSKSISCAIYAESPSEQLTATIAISVSKASSFGAIAALKRETTVSKPLTALGAASLSRAQLTGS